MKEVSKRYLFFFFKGKSREEENNAVFLNKSSFRKDRIFDGGSIKACVLARECEPLGATNLEESEPLIELFSTNSTGHSQKAGESFKKIFLVVQSWERGAS